MMYRLKSYLILLQAALDELGAADVDGPTYVVCVILQERPTVDEQQLQQRQRKVSMFYKLSPDENRHILTTLFRKTK